MRIVILGLSITSSRGNSHATTYRTLVRELCRRQHDVLFLERDVPWHASHRDPSCLADGVTRLYGSTEELRDTYQAEVQRADLVIVGSYVPDGVTIGRWVTEEARGVTAFYDLETPVTLAAIERGDCTYLSRQLIPRYDLYLSTTGGPILASLERHYGAQRAKPLYCSIDPERCSPVEQAPGFDLGYLGTYSSCRQSTLTELLLDPARAAPSRRMVVAGCQYPADIQWPANVERQDAPEDHRAFFASVRMALHVTRFDLIASGYAPSLTLFEAAACGRAVVSNGWTGLQTFFRLGSEIFIARSAADTLRLLEELSDRDLREVGRRARQRVLAQHTSAHRAAELELYVGQLARPLSSGAA